MLTDGSGNRTVGRSSSTPRRLVFAVLSALAVVLVGVWWLWPTLTGADGDVDVLVVGDPMLDEARRSIELRVREEGLSVEWYESSDSCDEIDTLESVIDDMEPTRVVVAFTAPDACFDAVAAAIGSADGVAVAIPATVENGGPEPAMLTAAGFRTIDPTRLTGAPGGPLVLPCEWWEAPCAPGGTEVRNADGSLTEAGGERLARVIAATL